MCLLGCALCVEHAAAQPCHTLFTILHCTCLQCCYVPCCTPTKTLSLKIHDWNDVPVACQISSMVVAENQ